MYTGLISVVGPARPEASERKAVAGREASIECAWGIAEVVARPGRGRAEGREGEEAGDARALWKEGESLPTSLEGRTAMSEAMLPLLLERSRTGPPRRELRMRSWTFFEIYRSTSSFLRSARAPAVTEGAEKMEMVAFNASARTLGSESERRGRSSGVKGRRGARDWVRAGLRRARR